MKSLEQIRENLERGARMARRAERALTLVGKGIDNRHKLGSVIKSAADAAQKSFRREMFDEKDATQ